VLSGHGAARLLHGHGSAPRRCQRHPRRHAADDHEL